MIYLLAFKEANSFKENKFIYKKYNHLRQLYSFTELYSFQGTYQFIQGNYIHSRKTYSFREIISIQGNIFIYGTYIRSSSRHMFIQETIFIQQRCVRGHTEQKYLFKNFPQPLYDNYKLYNYYLLNKV